MAYAGPAHFSDSTRKEESISGPLPPKTSGLEGAEEKRGVPFVGVTNVFFTFDLKIFFRTTERSSIAKPAPSLIELGADNERASSSTPFRTGVRGSLTGVESVGFDLYSVESLSSGEER